MPLDKFNTVEQALKARAEELKTSGLVKTVSIADHGPSYYTPSILLWCRRGWSEEAKVGRAARLHTWRFEYVIDVTDHDLRKAYEKAKEIMWALYDRINQDRSLGISDFFVAAKPATEFERYELVSDVGKMEGQRLVMYVDVVVEA